MLTARSRTGIAVVLLAAGISARMGAPKQLLRYKNQTLLRHVTGQALLSHATFTCVVLGAESARVRQELTDLPVAIVENLRWDEGMSTSIRTGLACIPESVQAAIIVLCDQPLVSTGLLNTMMDVYVSSGKHIVACEYAGSLGVPALFDRSLFSELSQLSGDRGAKQIITQHAVDVYRMPFPGGSVDLDTLSDFEHLTV